MYFVSRNWNLRVSDNTDKRAKKIFVGLAKLHIKLLHHCKISCFYLERWLNSAVRQEMGKLSCVQAPAEFLFHFITKRVIGENIVMLQKRRTTEFRSFRSKFSTKLIPKIDFGHAVQSVCL